MEYVESYAYDPFGNVGRSVVTDGSGSLIADYQYEYDSLGRLIRGTLGIPLSATLKSIVPARGRD